MKDKATSFWEDKHLFVQPYDFYFTEVGFKSLRAYLGNVSKGQNKIYTAPFAKEQSMDQILNDWKSVLESIRDHYPSLWDFENDLANKVGPLSVQKPLDERYDDVAHYYEDILLPSKPVDKRAILACQDEFSKLRGLRVRGQNDTVDLMKKSTNSGNPFFTKRRNVIQDTVPLKITSNSFGTYQHLPEGYYLCCAVIGWRGQEGGPSEEDVKQRVVWMFPFGVNVAELQVYQPLIEGAQALNLVPAWVSMESVDLEVTALFDSKAKDDLIVCTDFSRFDQHFNPTLQEVAKIQLARLLTREKPSEEWLDRIFPVKYRIPLVFADYENHHGHKSVVGLDGAHGMASGSGGTNVDETLAHRTLQHEAAILHGQTLNPHSMCLGDDGILTYPGITVDDVVETYQSHGQECNKDKQYASTQDCVYLRRWHSENYRVDGVCVGVYSTCRALGRLRYLERFMDPEYWSPELVALRQLSIIENCKWHPLFEQFVQFCMKRDKYRLGIDIPGFLDNIVQLANEATDHIKDFLGYTKTLQGEGPDGIASWRVVKYLKSLR